MPCPLCSEKKNQESVPGKDKRKYWLCNNCYLIYADKRHQPDRKKERDRYLSHENGIEFPGYVDFLNRAIQPALSLLDENQKGLDYGCGNRPTLSKLLTTFGIRCSDYDPIFFPEGIRAQSYDFIFATECFEHFFNPGQEIKKIDGLLKDDGVLVMMTALWESVDQFKDWFYTRDITHVSFFHAKTLEYIRKEFGWQSIDVGDERVFIWQKTIA